MPMPTARPAGGASNAIPAMSAAASSAGGGAATAESLGFATGEQASRRAWHCAHAAPPRCCAPPSCPFSLRRHSLCVAWDTHAGGAQDIENFRENVEAGFLPLPTDLSFEGLAKDYYFDTSRSVWFGLN